MLSSWASPLIFSPNRIVWSPDTNRLVICYSVLTAIRTSTASNWERRKTFKNTGTTIYDGVNFITVHGSRLDQGSRLLPFTLPFFHFYLAASTVISLLPRRIFTISIQPNLSLPRPGPRPPLASAIDTLLARWSRWNNLTCLQIATRQHVWAARHIILRIQNNIVADCKE